MITIEFEPRCVVRIDGADHLSSEYVVGRLTSVRVATGGNYDGPDEHGASGLVDPWASSVTKSLVQDDRRCFGDGVIRKRHGNVLLTVCR